MTGERERERERGIKLNDYYFGLLFLELCFASSPRLMWGALVPEVPGRFPSLVSLILRLKQVEDAKVVHQLMLHSTTVATDHDCASLPGVRINELRHPRVTELARE